MKGSLTEEKIYHIMYLHKKGYETARLEQMFNIPRQEIALLITCKKENKKDDDKCLNI